MEIQPSQKLEAAKRGDYEVTSSDWISQGWDFFKNNAGLMIGYVFMVFGIAMVAQFIPFLGPLAQAFVISPALAFGFYLYAYQYDRKGQADFNTFFDGFQHLGRLVPVILLQMLVIMGAMIPFGIVMSISLDVFGGMEDPNFVFFGLAMIPLVAVAFYLGLSWMFAYPMAVFFDLGPWEAMEASRKAVTQQFWYWVGFALLLMVVSMAGAFALGIGLLVAYPVILYAQYAAFRDMTNLLAGETAQDDILEHLVG